MDKYGFTENFCFPNILIFFSWVNPSIFIVPEVVSFIIIFQARKTIFYFGSSLTIIRELLDSRCELNDLLTSICSWFLWSFFYLGKTPFYNTQILWKFSFSKYCYIICMSDKKSVLTAKKQIRRFLECRKPSLIFFNW